MQVDSFLGKLKNFPESIEFEDTMAAVDAGYLYTPTEFTNGEITNRAGENEGSCKLFSFAKLHNLTQEQTLACFGKHYREDVLRDPVGDSHQNIRNFMRTGWSGIKFENDALVSK
jgi:hypothetical protein